MGFVRVWRPTLEAELIGGSSQDNQLEEDRGLGRGRQTHPGWDRDGGERKNMKYNGGNRAEFPKPNKERKNKDPERILALILTHITGVINLSNMKNREEQTPLPVCRLSAFNNFTSKTSCQCCKISHSYMNVLSDKVS